MKILYWILLIAGGFLLGGVMFCELIPKKLLNKDICEISVDNNPGAFNVFKHCGKKIGIPCLLLDLFKGVIPVLLAALLLNANCIAFVFVTAAPVFGHAIGLFNRFRGGKCITTSFGVMLGLLPVTWIGIVTLAALYILFSTIIKIRNAGVRSIVVFVLFATITCTVLAFTEKPYAAASCGAVALFPILKFFFSKDGLAENKFRDKPAGKDEEPAETVEK